MDSGRYCTFVISFPISDSAELPKEDIFMSSDEGDVFMSSVT